MRVPWCLHNKYSTCFDNKIRLNGFSTVAILIASTILSFVTQSCQMEWDFLNSNSDHAVVAAS